MLKFILPLIVVEDVAASRRFYEDFLAQKVLHDFGEDVQFESGFYDPPESALPDPSG